MPARRPGAARPGINNEEFLRRMAEAANWRRNAGAANPEARRRVREAMNRMNRAAREENAERMRQAREDLEAAMGGRERAEQAEEAAQLGAEREEQAEREAAGERAEAEEGEARAVHGASMGEGMGASMPGGRGKALVVAVGGIVVIFALMKLLRVL